MEEEEGKEDIAARRKKRSAEREDEKTFERNRPHKSENEPRTANHTVLSQSNCAAHCQAGLETKSNKTEPDRVSPFSIQLLSPLFPTLCCSFSFFFRFLTLILNLF